MHWPNVKLILLREVRDQLRDRRTLFMIAVLPLLLYPLLGMSFLKITQFMHEQPAAVLVIGQPDVPGLPPLIEGGQFAAALFSDAARSSLLELRMADPGPASGQAEKEPLDAGRLVAQKGKYELVVAFPPDFSDQLEKFRSELRSRKLDDNQPAPEIPSPVIYYNKAKEKSQIAHARVCEVLDRWTEAIGQQNLKDSQVPASTARPFSLDTKDVAEAGQTKAALWAKILPFVLLLWALTGAFYPAVDLCAGEKERGTLETLLSSPAERIEIVCGKLLTVMLFSMATAILNLASMVLIGTLMMSHFVELGPPPLMSVMWLLIALVPVSALFSALCLALAAFARSTKEGQYYLMPLVLLIMPLTVLPMTPGVELSVGNSLIPVTGVVLLLREMLGGNYLAALPYIPLVAGVTLLCVYWAVRWAADQFNTESVLFRESERFDLGLWLKQLYRQRQDTPTVGQAVMCALVMLMIQFFMTLAAPAGDLDFKVVAAVVQLAAIATPALLMTVMLTRSPAQTLLLRLPPLAAVPAALALAVAIHPLADTLRSLVQWVYPISKEMEEQLKGLLSPDATQNIGALLLAVAVLPAICEELAFRGFVLSGLRHLGHKWRAIVLSSVLFGMAHGFFQQSLLACLVGMVIGYLAVQTGSLLPGVLFHMVHNSLSILRATTDWSPLASRHTADWFFHFSESEGLSFNWPSVALSVLATAAILVWFHKLPYARTSEESLQEAIEKLGERRNEVSVQV